jgi:hypothetical protein
VGNSSQLFRVGIVRRRDQRNAESADRELGNNSKIDSRLKRILFWWCTNSYPSIKRNLSWLPIFSDLLALPRVTRLRGGANAEQVSNVISRLHKTLSFIFWLKNSCSQSQCSGTNILRLCDSDIKAMSKASI